VVSQRLWFAEAAERAAGFLLTVATSPLLLSSAAAVAFLSRRSPFVAHLRVGKDNQPFWMLKLRTMWCSDEVTPRKRGWVEYIVAEPAGDGKDVDDPRITSSFAAYCRRHSIDELPQLWQVARGEMSLVGPRPLTRSEIERYYGERASELLSVKPGITGLWQVYGRSTIKFPKRSAMDLELVRSLTPKMYLTILLRTITAFVTGEGAW
jgi:lipopolysaccharide/colanic/teichoic acid biosynthesis glycosyltransferase